jgi:hypothetical protein
LTLPFADFKYANDSVLLVDRAAFDACNPKEPVSSFADGATTFRLDRPGFFCFISGAPGHCEEGQRLVVRVMVHSATPAPGPAAAQGPAAAAAPQQPGHGGSGGGRPEQPGLPGASSATVAAAAGVAVAAAAVALVSLVLMFQ